MFYSLTKTNPRLTGNITINSTLKNDNGSLKIDKIFINSLDNFNYEKMIINPSSSYIYDISKYYKKNSGNFYDIQIPNKIKNNYARITSREEINWNDVNMCGVKRISNISNNKTFRLFTPVWCDNIDDFPDQLKLIIKSTSDNSNILFEKNIIFDKNDPYFKYIYNSFEGVDRNILNIDFNNKQTIISGISLDGGRIQKSYKDLCNILLNKETLIIENNNSIVESYEKNNMVISQLINLTWDFDIIDLDWWNIDKYFFQDIYIDFEFIKNDKIIKKKSLDFNHDEFYTIEDIDKKNNIINYLKDNKYINYKYLNKINQNINKWSIRDVNEYIFNLYDGFSLIDKYKYTKTGYYFKTPNIYSQIPDKDIYNIHYAKFENVMNSADNQYSISSIIHSEVPQNNICFFNGIKYDWNNKHKFTNTISKFGIFIFNVPKYIFSDIPNNYDEGIKYKLYNKDGNYFLQFFISDNKIIGMDELYKSKYANSLTFINMIHKLIAISNDTLYENLKYIFDGFIKYKTIKLPVTLRYKPLDNIKLITSKQIDEVDYINEDESIILYRYDGYLYPTFCDTDTTYFKLLYDNNFYETYKNNQNVKPIYESVDYFTINNNKKYHNTPCEYRLDNISKIIFLKKQYSFFSENFDDIKMQFKKYIKKYTNNVTKIEYIINNYDYNIIYDYDLKKFKITYNLK